MACGIKLALKEIIQPHVLVSYQFSQLGTYGQPDYNDLPKPELLVTTNQSLSILFEIRKYVPLQMCSCKRVLLVRSLAKLL